jgi:hypothetical protein
VGDFNLATLLADGRVLIAHNSAAEVYDPATGAFSLAGPYAQPPYCCVELGTITLLVDGRVLLTGCTSPCRNGANQIYDPRSNTFSVTGDMKYYDHVNNAMLMMDGRVLLAGNSENDGFRADAETYDPSAGTFRSIGNTIGSHEFSAATLLPDRSVLITGGAILGGNGNSDSELFVPATGAFSLTAKLTTPRSGHSSTLLPDGTVLIAGGYSVWPNATTSAEIYRPRYLQRPAALLSLSGEGGGQGQSSMRAHITSFRRTIQQRLERCWRFTGRA